MITAPSPRSSRGEGWGEGLSQHRDSLRVPLTRIASQSDLSPQAGRGDLNSRVADSTQSRHVLTIEHDHATHGLAGLHRGKAFVDLAELQFRRYPVLQMQPAAHVEFNQARHVDPEMVRAHRRSLDLALAQKVKAVQLDLLAERDHADDGRRPSWRQHRERLFRGLLAAQHLEGMI